MDFAVRGEAEGRFCSRAADRVLLAVVSDVPLDAHIGKIGRRRGGGSGQVLLGPGQGVPLDKRDMGIIFRKDRVIVQIAVKLRRQGLHRQSSASF